jgi:hypothetical protein
MKREIKKYKIVQSKADVVSDTEAPYQQQPLSFNEVWLMFQETDRRFQETDRRFRETREQFRETREQFRETREQMKDTDKRLKKLDELFTSQWGKLMESLVEGDLVPLLNARGIAVHRTMQRIENKTPPPDFEFDILAVNDMEAVFVEVKTTLKPEDINHFLGKLDKVKEWMPSYNDYTIYGAVAYLRTDASCIKMAEKKGLFVIRATGKSASIINGEDFMPRRF